MKLTVLGCGASLGTPAAGGFWGSCDPQNLKNHRTRASVLVETESATVLVDTTVDLRQHLNLYQVKRIDGVLISHSHSDHVNGIDELRVLAYHQNKLMDLYAANDDLTEISRRWPYLFNGEDPLYTPFLERKMIRHNVPLTIGDIEILPFKQDHKTCVSYGFRFGKVAYSVDVADFSDESLALLKGVETWIVDASAYRKETVLTHANIQRVLKWVDILKPKMTYLTVLTTHMDYQTLCDELPPHVRPAYDGLVIDTEGNCR